MSANSPGAEFLLISDLDDAPRRSCVDRFAQAGLHLNVVPDVYMALARLVLGEPIRQVLLDVRAVDDVEMAFIRLVDRYAPSTTLFIPNLEGTARRLQRYGEDIRATELESIVAFAKDAARVTASAAQPAKATAIVEQPLTPVKEVEEPQSVASPLSTDGGPESAVAGPSLHEAVRMRMSQGTATPSARRSPPRAAKGGAARGHTPALSNSNDATLTPQELKALLQQEPDNDVTSDAKVDRGQVAEGHPS